MLRGKGTMGKINLGLRREIQTEMSLVILRINMRGVVFPKLLILLSLLVERNIFGSF